MIHHVKMTLKTSEVENFKNTVNLGYIKIFKIKIPSKKIKEPINFFVEGSY